MVKAHAPAEKYCNLALIATTFTEAAGRDTIWEPFLEDFDPMKSKLHEKWYAAAEARSKAEGAIARLRNNLLRLLNNKFPSQMAFLANLLQKQEDLAALDLWYERDLQAKTSEEFCSLINVAI